MEPQEKEYCYEKPENKPEYRCGKKRNCYGIVAVILLVAFVAVIGLIIGAAISGAILGALAAVIVLAVVLGLLVIIAIILAICNKKDKNKKKHEYH